MQQKVNAKTRRMVLTLLQKSIPTNVVNIQRINIFNTLCKHRNLLVKITNHKKYCLRHRFGDAGYVFAIFTDFGTGGRCFLVQERFVRPLLSKTYVTEIVLNVDVSWYKNTIISGSYKKTKQGIDILYAEDVLVYKGNNVLHQDLSSRIRLLKQSIATQATFDPSRDMIQLLLNAPFCFVDLMKKCMNVKKCIKGIVFVPFIPGTSYLFDIVPLHSQIQTVTMKLKSTKIVDLYWLLLQTDAGNEVTIGKCLVQNISLRLNLYRLFQTTGYKTCYLPCRYDVLFDQWYPVSFTPVKHIGTVEQARSVKENIVKST